MDKLIAQTPCDGLLPLTIGTVSVTEVDPGAIHAVSAFQGQAKSLSEAMKAAHGMALPAPNRATGKSGARAVWFGPGQAMLIGPGSPAQMLHRDCENWLNYCVPMWPNCPEITISAMIALEEVTEELGATRVIPGSHKWADMADHGSHEQTVPATMKPGDALLYSGRLIHGGGANTTTDQWRHAMHLSFLVGWLVPEESSPIDYTDEDLANQSARVQRLLGHRSYDPRPHHGGGLWLRHANKIEDQSGAT